jgi:hypothetical protein
MTTARSDRL